MKTHVVLHHSLTRDSGTVSAQAIRRYHVETLRWRDVGYHFLVERIEDRYEMIVGRPLLSRAAAAYQQSMNRIGVHYCLVGNFDNEAPPDALLEFVAPHVADVMEVFGMDGLEHIIGHRDVASYKTCPGKLFDVVKFRSLVRGG